MNKLKMHSPDLTQANIDKLAEIFPNCVTEARDDASGVVKRNIDFDQLRQELSTSIVEGPQERYQLNWPGKREALLTANVSQDLLSEQVNNIRGDRTSEDLLFQVLLDWGVDLALPITQETISGKTVLLVDGHALAACFEEGVSEAFVKLLAKREPLRAVFRDAGFASDSVKINVEQIFKLMSPGTEVKTI